MNDCIAVNIQDMLKAIGEEGLLRLLSDFSCPLNREKHSCRGLYGVS